MDIDLTKEQSNIIEEIIDWHRTKYSDYITIGGYAGTGKTTIISFIADELKKENRSIRIAFCAFTGKASSVLKSKIKNSIRKTLDNVSTIHSLMYSPKYKVDSRGRKVIDGWIRKDEIEYDIIIIDEGSMINQYIWNDLKSYNIPIIVIGDHGQLPPIGEKYGLLKNPQLKLMKIHRQASKNPIIKLSMDVRHNGHIPHGIYSPHVFKLSWRDPRCQYIFNKVEWDSDVITLCGFNATRVKINNMIREKENYKMAEPYPGERLICLKNNHTTKIMNGQIGTVQWFRLFNKTNDLYKIDLEMDNSDDIYSSVVWNGCFGKEKYDEAHNINFNKIYKDELKKSKETVDLFDYGYSISVHRSQGSEWPRIVLFEQRSKYWDDAYFKKWLYTAVTRARERLFIISDFY